uniref:Odorant-binding protein 57d1 n=1 Tax=Drosophila varians TaxID=30050 RepID=B0M2C6_DROVA|nr:odorant-binding protein 57d1 [Drosophila varians]
MPVGLQVLSVIIIFQIIQVVSFSEDPCENHYGISEKEASEIMEDWPANLAISKVNRTQKCRVACTLLYYGLLHYSGEIHMDKYFDAGVIDELEVSSTIVRCHYEFRNEKDICEYAFGIFYCFRMDLLLNLESSEGENLNKK